VSNLQYVIIGNSAAAVGCVEGIRQIDQAGEITIISREKYHTYSRPLISYLIRGKTDMTRIKYRPDSFYEDNRCRTILDQEAVKIDKDKKEVILADGSSIPYDRLLVATGSRPFIPHMPGLEEVEKKFTFNSLDDALALDAALSYTSRVLIIGSGLIGMKCAEGIAGKAASITIVEHSPYILSSILDSDAARLVQSHVQRQNVSFILSSDVIKLKNGRATLQNDREIDFDILVVACGTRPETTLGETAGIAVNNGIVTDNRCATNVENIYAAGDCTESFDITTGEKRIMALLPNAYMQGEAAGINMVGGQASFDKAIPMNAIGFFGLHIITAGSYDGKSYIFATPNSYKRLIYKDNLLKGFILINDVLHAGIYTSLIREKVPLDTIDFDLIKEKPQLMAFSKRERAVKLGGAQ